MNQGRNRIGGSRLIPGCLLGLLLALASPFLLLTELFAPMPLVMFASAGIILLHHWAGRMVSSFTMFMVLLVGEIMMGSGFLWIAFFSSVLPLLLMLRQWKKPFFYQLKYSLAAFGGGLLVSVLVMYFSFGSDMIAKLLGQFPEVLRMLPQENINILLQSMESTLGEAITAEELYKLFDSRIDDMILLFQIRLPGMLFSGAIITAVLCVVLNNRALAQAGLSDKGCYVPVSQWHLPASTTGGLLLIGVVSYIMATAKMEFGLTVFQTVYDIIVWAFCFQGMASVARRLGGSRRAQIAMPVFMIVMSLFGAASYFAIYGGCSALFGSNGAVREYMNRKHPNNGQNNSNQNE